MVRTATLALLIALQISCTVSSNTRVNSGADNVKLNIYIDDNFTDREVRILKAALVNVTETTRKGIKKLIREKNKEHFAVWVNDEKKYNMAHAHYWGKICFNPMYVLEYETAYHEFMHIGTNTAGYRFEREWKEVAGNIYCDDYWRYSYHYPYSAVLNSYALKNHDEDIAVWGQYIYVYCYHNDSDAKTRLLQVNGKDERIYKKLKLLKDYGLIKTDDYEAILKLWETLR